MALIACRECGAKVSDSATACPSCGHPVPSKVGTVKKAASGIWTAIKLFVALIIGIVVFQCTSLMNSSGTLDKLASSTAPMAPTTAKAETPSCSPSDITIKSLRASFKNACTRTPCYGMVGVGVLVNRCSEPIGVQIKITGLSKAGEPLASRDLWPASVSNIPPGEYTFSMDSYLDYDPGIVKFEVSPIAVKRWRR